MVTRFYYTYNGPGPVVRRTPEDAYPWTEGPATGAGYGFALVLVKSATYALMGPVVQSLASGASDVLLGCWYSPPLQPQDISGTVKGRIRLTTSGGGSAAPDMRIALVRADGSLRSWIYTGVDPAAPGGTNQFPPVVDDGDSVSFDTVSPSAGDRLLVMLGVVGLDGGGGEISLDLTANVGDDLPESESVGSDLTADPDHPGLYLITPGSTLLTADPDHPGLYLITPGSTLLTEDPTHLGLYLIGT